jgi:ferredoxin
MHEFRYLYDVSTLSLNREECIGCGICEIVCPHGVFKLKDKKADVIDKNGCMECGACAKNCPSKAISVTPGVGCAAYIIQTWIIGITGNSRGMAKCC